MNKKLHLPNRVGFTFIEILVSVIIIAIIAVLVSTMLLGGFTNLKQAELKSRAIGLADLKMKQVLAKAYSDPTLRPENGQWRFEEPDYTDALVFNWSIDVENGGLKNPTTDVTIPYKNITVCVKYSDYNRIPKEIRLKNTITYPYIHTDYLNIRPNPDAVDCPRVPGGPLVEEFAADPTAVNNLNIPHSRPARDSDYETIRDSEHDFYTLHFDYRVPKDLLVMVNLVIKASKEAIQMAFPHATVWTRFLLDGNPVGPVNRTPIRSQPFISCRFGLEDIPPGPHTLQVQWCKDINSTKESATDKYTVDGAVSLQDFAVSLVAYEGKTVRDYKP